MDRPFAAERLLSVHITNQAENKFHRNRSRNWGEWMSASCRFCWKSPSIGSVQFFLDRGYIFQMSTRGTASFAPDATCRAPSWFTVLTGVDRRRRWHFDWILV